MRVTSIAFSSDGKKIVTASSDSSARVWDALSGEQLAIFAGGPQGLWSARFRPDGQIVAIAGLDRHVALWDIATGVELTRTGDLGQIYAVRYSPDGTRLLILPFDAPPALWRVADFDGTADDLAAIVKCTSPWRVNGSALVPALQDVSACR